MVSKFTSIPLEKWRRRSTPKVSGEAGGGGWGSSSNWSMRTRRKKERERERKGGGGGGGGEERAFDLGLSAIVARSWVLAETVGDRPALII